MAIAPFAPGSITARQSGARFVEMRAQLADMQRQLSTGMKSETYGGLGIDRRLSLDLRSKLASLASYQRAIKEGELRVRMMLQSVDVVQQVAATTKSDMAMTTFQLGSDGRTPTQERAENRLKVVIDALNAGVNGNYLFSGRTPEQRPVASYEAMMNGEGADVGLKTLIEERAVAERRNGLGGLDVASGGGSVTITDPAVPSQFGFTIVAVAGTGALVATNLAGPPPGASVAAAGANAGDRLTVTLRDGNNNSYTIELTAKATLSGAKPTREFLTGAGSVASLEAALTAAIEEKIEAELLPRATTETALNFFDSPIMRVDAAGTALEVAAGGVVSWYRGEADDPADPARETARVRVDAQQTVGVGARAGEEGFRNVLGALAALSLTTFPPGNGDGAKAFNELLDVAAKALNPPAGSRVEDVAISLGNASGAMLRANERHVATTSMLRDSLSDIETPSPEEVAAAMLSLQTRLQASYQTTAILSQLSLVNYL